MPVTKEAKQTLSVQKDRRKEEENMANTLAERGRFSRCRFRRRAVFKDLHPVVGIKHGDGNDGGGDFGDNALGRVLSLPVRTILT